jgi:hypothetical protein
MDFLKTNNVDEKVRINLQLQLLSITVLTPPHQSVNVFLKIVRNNKVLHESKKFKVEPKLYSKYKTNISFQDGELMKTNRYYTLKTGSR